MKTKFISHKVIAAGIACVLLMLACSVLGTTPAEPVSPPTDVEQAPVASNTPRSIKSPEPVNTPVPPPTEAPETPSCYRWDKITLDMAGETVCVYGKAYSHQGKSRIDFSVEKNSFFLIDPVYYYPDMAEGVCVAAEEKVEIFDNKIPFMTIRDGKLFKCEPWMEE
ncbi:MAG: hypothetical protein MUO77_12115 [Anaerolineales bacterium]|nr:hypothetical protein [Anaerolineales bacterium]